MFRFCRKKFNKKVQVEPQSQIVANPWRHEEERKTSSLFSNRSDHNAKQAWKKSLEKMQYSTWNGSKTTKPYKIRIKPGPPTQSNTYTVALHVNSLNRLFD